MKKNLLLLFITISSIFISCAFKNQYGKKRFKSLLPYSKKMIILDSLNVFKGYYVLRDEKQKPLRKNFIVFYSNGKVGNFLDYSEDNFDFNPEKAEMGFFGTKNNQNFLKFKTLYPNGYKVSENEIIYLDKDSLIIYIKESATGGGFTSKYYKDDKTKFKNFLKPDW